MPNSHHGSDGRFSSGGGGGSSSHKLPSGITRAGNGAFRNAAGHRMTQTDKGGFIRMSDAVARMYGTGSPQHKKALAQDEKDAKKASMKKTTVSIQKAADIAADFSDTEFTTAVEEARSLGLSSVEIVTVDDDGATDIYVARPNGLMIAWKPADWVRDNISIPGGIAEDDVHLTVVYLGDASNFDTEQQRTIIAVTAQVASEFHALNGQINGFGRFLNPNDNNENPLWLGVDVEGLDALRDRLVDELKEAGIEWEDTFPSYVPHITVAYIDADDETPAVQVTPWPICIDNLTVYIGGLEYPNELDDIFDQDPNLVSATFDSGPSRPNLYYPKLSKSAQVLDEDLRYSYGAWYVPNSVDAHGEWADPETVQKSLWDYVDSGNRDIHLQHQPDIKAGRWVELATVPFPVTVPIEIDGQLRKHTYPAGTPFMGVKWEEWAWPLVKEDKLRGFSVGGTASRIEADFEEQALQKAVSARPKD